MTRLHSFWLLIISITAFTPTHAAERIITLSPHLTEWIYSLNAEERLVGVSAFSDYPADALKLPVIADYQGVNFTALMALEPDLVLAWAGGNKPQDITRLKSLGINVYLSQPQTLQDIAIELDEVASLIGSTKQAKPLIRQFRDHISQLRSRYQAKSTVTVFYYMWSQPLMTIGKNAWANQLLTVCGAESVFSDSPIDYPEVTVKQVLLRQPQLLVAASDQSVESLEHFWSVHRQIIKAPLITANANALHRFTLRIPNAIDTLCRGIDAYR